MYKKMGKSWKTLVEEQEFKANCRLVHFVSKLDANF